MQAFLPNIPTHLRNSPTTKGSPTVLRYNPSPALASCHYHQLFSGYPPHLTFSTPNCRYSLGSPQGAPSSRQAPGEVEVGEALG